MKFKNIIILTVAAAIVSSCNPSRFGWTPDDQTASDTGSPRMVEDFDPLSLNEDDIVIEKNALSSRTVIEDQNVEAGQAAEEIKESGPEMVPGFRVNLMSGKDEAAINEEYKKAMFKFQHSVYVVFESPYYKIRLGDFLTEEEAAVVRDRAQRLFPGAFLARCLVYREKAELNHQQ